MKKVIFGEVLFLFFTVFGCKQEIAMKRPEITAEQVLAQYYKEIGRLENLSYRMHKVDSFLSGEVWDRTGYCILKRDHSDSLFGFLFKGKRDDLDKEVIYYGDEIYEVNLKTKEYSIDREQIHRGVLGSTGGQMVLEEIVLKEKAYQSLSMTQTDSSYILRFGYPENKEYDITNRYKELHIDNRTFLPFYKYHSLESLGAKQVTKAAIYNAEVNNPRFEDPFLSRELPDNYSYAAPKKTGNKLVRLLNKTAPDFELSDLNGTVSKLSQQKGKVILLDFWEIWCGPCVKNIPQLMEFSEKYSDEGFEVWSIVSDPESFEKVKVLADKKGLNYRVLKGNPAVSNQYFVNAVPLYVLINKEGIVKHAGFGFSPELEPLIKEQLQ